MGWRIRHAPLQVVVPAMPAFNHCWQRVLFVPWPCAVVGKRIENFETTERRAAQHLFALLGAREGHGLLPYGSSDHKTTGPLLTSDLDQSLEDRKALSS